MAIVDPDSFQQVKLAIADIAAGKPVVVVDDEDRENEGDLIFAADKATPELLAFMVRHTSGFVCVSLQEEDCQRLNLPPMCQVNEDARGTAYTVTVDAVGVGTGISATDRARTIRLLADPAAGASDFTRPGHVVPLRARAGGVLTRAGHTEASVDLAILAGLAPVGVLCEIVSRLDETSMARRDELEYFARAHDLTLISVADLIEYRQFSERQIDRRVEARMPFACGTFRALGYSSQLDDREHVALIDGDIGDGEDVLVHLHFECLTCDVFGSLRCDCGSQLQTSLEVVAAEGRGVVLYVRGHRGRGAALLNKLQALNLEDHGAYAFDGGATPTRPVNVPDYVVAAQILREIGVVSLRLLTDNPGEWAEFERHGLRVTGLAPSAEPPHPQNVLRVDTARNRMNQRQSRSIDLNSHSRLA